MFHPFWKENKLNKEKVIGWTQAPYAFFKWLFIAVLTGTVVGLVGTGFLYCINLATSLRKTTLWLVWLLPIAGLMEVFLYRVCGVKKPQGTDLVLLAVRSPSPLPFRMAPLIFISTVITHLFGGSAGREGAALQMGGSLGFSIGRVLKLDEKDLHIITMCGMSAAFAALFGTPITSAVFAMEVTSVGVMYYAALVPCAVASLLAVFLARSLGIAPEVYPIAGIPSLSVSAMLLIILLAALCSALSVLYCWTLRGTGKLYRRWLANPYLRAAVGGALVLLLSLAVGREYLGAGMDVISAALKGNSRPEAFVLKLIFTALTIGAGFKGGEIVPGFFVGATFGCTAASLLGLSPAFGAALGLISVFCGVTNCPLTALLLGVELFGAQGAPYYLLAAAVSYMLSGYTGLYSRQRILYSKYKPEFLGKNE